MRQLRYAVAMSLDGYIASTKGDYDWIVMDPEIDFGAIFRRYDAFVMGRRTFTGFSTGGGGGSEAMVIVASRTLRQEDYPKATIVADGIEGAVKVLKSKPGKDIWLFGGGEMFRSLLAAGLVDAIEVAVIPVLLGGGTPLLPAPATQVKLRLTGNRLYQKSGIMSLEYSIEYPRRRKAG
jgi:dihydrofolate reductase